MVVTMEQHINGLVLERSNSIANALELHLSGTNPSIIKAILQKFILNQHSWLCHDMEPLSILLALCEENPFGHHRIMTPAK